MSTYALRATLVSGGAIQQPLACEEEPTIEEAKAMWPRLVGAMPPDAEWSIVADERQPAVEKKKGEGNQ